MRRRSLEDVLALAGVSPDPMVAIGTSRPALEDALRRYYHEIPERTLTRYLEDVPRRWSADRKAFYYRAEPRFVDGLPLIGGRDVGEYRFTSIPLPGGVGVYHMRLGGPIPHDEPRYGLGHPQANLDEGRKVKVVRLPTKGETIKVPSGVRKLVGIKIVRMPTDESA